MSKVNRTQSESEVGMSRGGRREMQWRDLWTPCATPPVLQVGQCHEMDLLADVLQGAVREKTIERLSFYGLVGE